MVFRWDVCGILCLFFTYFIIFYADYVVLFHIIRPVLKNSFAAALHAIAFNLIILLLGLSHVCAVFCDPGLISLTQFPFRENCQISEKPVGWSVCNRCSVYRPPRSHHCRICGRCVRRMDHHCPWINNCVGEYNQKYFLLFLFYVGVLCIYALMLIIICRAVLNNDDKTPTKPDSMVVAHTIILVAICCLFGLFVLAVFSDQYKSIVDDETPIEALQIRANRNRDPTNRDVEANLGANSNVARRRRLSKWQLFREVFGGGPVYLWFLPCHYLFKPANYCNEQVIVVRPNPNPDQIPMVQVVLPDSPIESDASTDVSSV